MPDHPVYQTGKDRWGNITALGGPFGQVSHVEAILAIEHGFAQYFVPLTDGTAVPVEVRNGPLGKYLRTNWDGQQRNNLVDLPDC